MPDSYQLEILHNRRPIIRMSHDGRREIPSLLKTRHEILLRLAIVFRVSDRTRMNRNLIYPLRPIRISLPEANVMGKDSRIKAAVLGGALIDRPRRKLPQTIALPLPAMGRIFRRYWFEKRHCQY